MKEMRERILVVDDAAETLELIQRHLAPEGYRVFTSASVKEAIRILEEQPVDLVVTDLKMPKASGLDLVRHVRENLRDTEIMMITGYASIEGAVTAVKLGAEEYLAKPFTREELLAAVDRVLQTLRLRRTATPGQEPASVLGLVGESEAMRRVQALLLREAGGDDPVLLVGDSGAGKETAARAIHYGGPRAGELFFLVNCAGIPADRIEREIFGPRSGRDGAARDGFHDLARGSTLYLAAVEAMPGAAQERLLAPLADGAGAAREQRVRLIAGSTLDADALERRGVLHPELRRVLLSTVVQLPPLRERGDDVLLLARHFVARVARETGGPAPRFSDRALAVLREYQWPGNVGELQHVITSLVASTESGLIDVPDLPSLMRFSALRGGGMHRSLAEVEFHHIQIVLSGVGGNKTKAAEILGIDRKTLREKLKAAGDSAA